MSAEPDVRTIILQREHQAIALVCDGIADVMTPEDVAGVLQYHVGNEKNAGTELVQEAFKRDSPENLTAVTVYFRWPEKRTHNVAFSEMTKPPPPSARRSQAQEMPGSKASPTVDTAPTPIKNEPKSKESEELKRDAKSRRLNQENRTDSVKMREVFFERNAGDFPSADIV